MATVKKEIVTKNRVKLIIESRNINGQTEISFLMENKEDCILHWGLSNYESDPWRIPACSLWPENSRAYGTSAIQTPFIRHNGENRIDIRLDQTIGFSLIQFVLFYPAQNRWDNNHGKNYHIRLPLDEKAFTHIPYELVRDESGAGTSGMASDQSGLFSVAEKIIGSEMGRNSWTLMHRFNLCYDLLEGLTNNNIEGLALIYVWLRFSATRQLTWQHNYNTKPRELSHAQERLTLRLADLYINSNAEGRELIRLILTTLGRGGEGQRIRDDVLHIMHKHHIKEVSGHFMEEWHQKLHNNTTPDDIIICEAYLEFLRGNGNLSIFYKTLEAGGVTKKRLESFERPIVTPPDFVPHLKDGLIQDLENFLKLLKSVHSGTDLENAINRARYLYDAGGNNLLDYIWKHRDDNKEQAVNLVDRITETRRGLMMLLKRDMDNQRVRDMLYLDLALEEFLRIIVERNIHSHFNRDQLVELIGMIVENLRFSYDEEGLLECFAQWKRLKGTPPFGYDWSLHAKSILDRIERIAGGLIDRYYRLFQPKSESMGKALKVESWAIILFSEEVVRGRIVFVLSILIRQLDRILRKTANIGNWQIISPGYGMGRVDVMDNLRSIQGRRSDYPSVIVADKVTGDEEIPEDVQAVITPDDTDIVSHVAVRARNAHLLFATCYNDGIIKQLKSLKGRLINLTVNQAGEVVFEEKTIIPIQPIDKDKLIFKEEICIKSSRERSSDKLEPIAIQPDFIGYAISEKDFEKGVVGRKARNLLSVRERLPDWIRLPISVAIPFGVFERVIAEDRNRTIAMRYNELVEKLYNIDKSEAEAPSQVISTTLADLRKTVLNLETQEDLLATLNSVMNNAGLGQLDEKKEDSWMCIKRVWASKWNDRAYFSRKANGISHNDIFMAVLIQQLVEAEYAFVIHTVNPITGDRKELYAEIVLGLGEVLVGNYPGRALSFSAKKAAPEPKLLAYPSKGIGLFGGGLIFRSDSNGEDIEGYAGAGLYESVILEQPRKIKLDYTMERMIWDNDFRRDLLDRIAKIGIEVETAFDGAPQDIEGVFSREGYYVVQTRPQVGLRM